MDAKPHYFKIGIFVLVATALIVTAVVIFGAGLLAQDELLLESYFAESITGLSPGSPIEFRGVRMGKVKEIGFVGDLYELPTEDGGLSPYGLYVRVVVAMPRSKLPEFSSGQVQDVLGQMIERGARVRITSNILTGQAFLEMNYFDPNRFPVEEVPWTPRYPRIPAAPGELTTIKDSIDSILTQLQAIDVVGLAGSLEDLFTSLNTAITEINLSAMSLETRAVLQVARQKMEALHTDKINASIQRVLQSLDQAVADANIPQLSRQASDLLTAIDRKLAALNAAQINADVERLLDTLNRSVADANVPALSQEAQGLMAELRTTNRQLQSLLSPREGLAQGANVPEVVARLGQTLSQINSLLATERPEIQIILAELRDTMDNLNDLVLSLQERPSELLFGNPPRESEVLR
ncbi:MAG: MCE family protein [Phycisphaerae bacterium]|nr:MCE family protein [Phycisphaerae bacterium]